MRAGVGTCVRACRRAGERTEDAAVVRASSRRRADLDTEAAAQERSRGRRVLPCPAPQSSAQGRLHHGGPRAWRRRPASARRRRQQSYRQQDILPAPDGACSIVVLDARGTHPLPRTDAPTRVLARTPPRGAAGACVRRRCAAYRSESAWARVRLASLGRVPAGLCLGKEGERASLSIHYRSRGHPKPKS